MEFTPSCHIIRQESVHPSPDSALLTRRARDVNWHIVAKNKVAQRFGQWLSNGDAAETIPSFVSDTVDRVVTSLIGKVDLDELDAHINRLSQAALQTYEYERGQIDRAKIVAAVEQRVQAVVKEILQEEAALAMQAS
ncbi:MAG: hypothetical protein V1876_01380 [Candidatus Peregrinibacteria bacterium]